MSYVVGETLYVNYQQHSRDRGLVEVKVTRVGKKWVYLDKEHWRFDKSTRALDGLGYTSPGTVYHSTTEYETERTSNEAWRSLQRDLQYAQRPESVSADNILKARALLCLPIKAEK